MGNLDIAVAVILTAALAFGLDAVTGRRGLAAPLLVAFTGALCGGFLAVRVFGVATMDQWPWVIWSVVGAALALGAPFLFRHTRCCPCACGVWWP